MIDMVYIASPSYSGSTLLTFLLNAHPSIATIGELKWGTIDLETYQCSCGVLLRECPFWNALQTRVQARGFPFDLNRPETDFRFPSHRLTDRVARARNRGKVFETLRDAAIAVLPASRRQWTSIAAINRCVIEAVLDMQGGALFVDASKDPVRLRHLLNTGEYDIRVIQLVRDGRGVVNSTINNRGIPAEQTAADWAGTHEQIERLGRQLDADRYLTIRYEDLCTDLTATCRGIFSFLGMDPNDVADDHRAVSHHILGNSMRLRDSCEIRLDEKWRATLSQRDQATFERIAGARNREYGYQ